MREKHLAVRGLIAVEVSRRVVAVQVHGIKARCEVVAVVLDALLERLGEHQQLLIEVRLGIVPAQQRRLLVRQLPHPCERVPRPFEAPPDCARHVAPLELALLRLPVVAARAEIVDAALVPEGEVHEQVVVEIGQHTGIILRLTVRALQAHEGNLRRRHAGALEEREAFGSVGEIDEVAHRPRFARRRARSESEVRGGYPRHVA